MALCTAAAAASGGAVTAVIFVPMVGGCLFFAARSIRAGVVVGEDALTVRGYARTVRVPWTKVAAVKAGSSGSVNPSARCVLLELANGDTIPIRGVGGFTAAVDRAAEQIADLRPDKQHPLG
jgi:hypothetical protein